MTTNQRRKQLLCASILLLCWAVGSECVAVKMDNIDTLEPIIRVSPANGTDLFGYSAILHQVAVPTDFESAIQNSRIIVGAPRGTFPGGLDNLETLSSVVLNETGLVYQCSLNDESCSAVGRSGTNAANIRLFDDQADGTALQTDNNLASMEQKSGQLMGQFLKSSGDYFIACAPRWIAIRDSSFIDNRRSLGRCFLSGRDLSEFMEVRPCRGDARNANDISTENRCQAGFGTLLYDNGSQTRLVVSAPGTFQGIGQLYQYTDVSSLTDIISPPNQRWVTLPSEAEASNGLDDGAAYYDGWSLATGDLRGMDGSIDSYVSGMPRFNLNDITGRVNVRNTNLSGFDSPPRLVGDQPGEYFGHSVATADLNNDGYDEIIVGAPLYSDADSALPDVGRVHIFVNNEGTINETAIILNSPIPNIARVRFGHSIVNLGDVNGDGFEDIAISAPYQPMDDEESTGAVYIYYGNGETVIERTPEQTITSSSVQAGLKTFGFSLSSEVDMDFNEYSDLVVGAYESQTAVLFRTRSVANINFQLNTSADTVDLVLDSGFNVTLCATYNGRGLNSRPLNVSFTLSEIPLMLNGQEEPRVLNPAGGYNGVLRFPSTDVDTCETITIGLLSIRNTTTNGLALRDPIMIQVTFAPVQRTVPASPTELTDFRDFPILEPTGASIVEITPTLSCTERISSNEVCTPDLSITFVPEGSRTEAVAGLTQDVRLVLRVSNLASEPAFNSMLNFSLPSDIYLSSQVLPGSSPGINCSQVEGSSRDYECSLPTYIPGGDQFDITLVWSVDRDEVVGTEDPFTATFIVGLPYGSIDRDNNTDNNMASVNLATTAITNAQVTINVVGPQTYSTTPPPAMIRTIDELGPTVDITVRFSNTGPSVIPNARLDVSIPVNSPTMGRFYLYISSLRTSGGTVNCNMDGVDPDGLNLQSRRRRSPVQRMKRQANQNSGEVNEVDCSNQGSPNGACETFTCDITNFGSQQIALTVIAVLDSRFYQSQTAGFSFTPFARITALGQFEDFDTNRDNDEAQTTYNIMAPVVDDLNLGIWLPIVGAVIALIIIIVIFIILIFCGFFRKKRLEKAKREAEAEYEVRQVPPEQPAVITGEDKKEVDLGEEVEMSKPELTTDDDQDIGDASDLQDGNGVGENGPTADGMEPEKDPEETSL